MAAHCLLPLKQPVETSLHRLLNNLQTLLVLEKRSLNGIFNLDSLDKYITFVSCVSLLHLFFRKSSFPADSHIIYQTYCISGHAVSSKQMASAGAWQGVERRGAYCNCQARSLESHSFLLHWSQSPYTCSPSSPLSNFSCKTDGEIWGRCEKGKLLSFTLKPQL